MLSGIKCFSKSSGSVNILNQGTNNITTLIGVSGINLTTELKKI